MSTNYNKVWRYVALTSSVQSMSINDTHYIVRSGDHYVGLDYPVWDRAAGENRVPALINRLRDKSEAMHYGSWADAQAVADQLQPQIEAAYSPDSVRYVSAEVERVDARPLISDIVAEWDLYLISGETREDKVDRIASHSFAAKNFPVYIKECKPLFVRYFKLIMEANDLWHSMSDEDADAYYDYLRALNAAKDKVHEVEDSLYRKGADAVSTIGMPGVED